MAPSNPPPQGLLLYCRAGFEGDCAAEIQGRAAALGVHGYCKAPRRSGYVVFWPNDPDQTHGLTAAIDFDTLIFVRQWFMVLALRRDLPARDRVTPLAAALNGLPAPVVELFLETPDTDEAKQLSRLLRALDKPLRTALAAAGVLATQGAAALRAHVCFVDGHTAYVGYADPTNSARWLRGIPRLRLPPGAPSRSALKLEEALARFLSPAEQEQYLCPGMRAVDLGAAPGGWTWVLVRRHLRVTAVDNGPLSEPVLESGLVEHLRADGFRYRPPRPVDWMVCDMVEQPTRVADLVARWLSHGWCRHAVFNLKLPMKRRYAETVRCLERVEHHLHDQGMAARLACKHLYHDREEVTAYAQRRDRVARGRPSHDGG